jgi:hypothetical protein
MTDDTTPKVLNGVGLTAEEASQFRAMLSTQVFSKVLYHLSQNAPRLHEDGDTNRILIRSGKAAGWSECVRRIMEAADPISLGAASGPFEFGIEGPAKPMYPPLDSDESWPVGQ